jgi:hypothetical protein
MPSRVDVPRQYSPRRIRRRSPVRVNRDSAWATASGEPSKSSGRQKRSRDERTRLRTSVATLVVVMVDIVVPMSLIRYAKLTSRSMSPARDPSFPTSICQAIVRAGPFAFHQSRM